MFFLIALLVGIIGASTVFVCKGGEKKFKITVFAVLTTIYTLIGWWIFWGSLFSTAWPLFGYYSAILMIWWAVSAVVTGALSENWPRAAWFPIVLFVVITITSMTGWTIFGKADNYSSLIGEFDTKNQKHWSKDIQPLDPTHLRLVPDSVAIYLAKTALAEDGNTLGSWKVPQTLDTFSMCF